MSELIELRAGLARIRALFGRLAEAVTRQAGRTDVRIEAVNARLDTTQAAVSALLAASQRTSASLGSLAVGSQDVAVLWPEPFPDTAYAVILNVISGTNALGSLHATLKTKSTEGAMITVANTGPVMVGAFAIDVIGLRIA